MYILFFRHPPIIGDTYLSNTSLGLSFSMNLFLGKVLFLDFEFRETNVVPLLKLAQILFQLH